MSILITNIKELLQVREPSVLKVSGTEMKTLPTIKDAYLYIEHDTIVEYGSMEELVAFDADEVIDATGKIVLPTWCDSHTHIVFAGHREQEFVDRINGMSYEDIALVMDCPVGTVRSRIFRAREAIDKEIAPLME